MTRSLRSAVLLFIVSPLLLGFDNEILHRFVPGPGLHFAQTAVEAVGDVDGNGIGDFVIGDYGHSNPGAFRNGRAYLYLAHRDPLRFERVVLEGTTDRGLFGKEIAPMGDLNDDGFADFVVTSENQRMVAVYFGRPQPPYHFRLVLAPPGVRTSDAVGVGDIDGDGAEEALVVAISDGLLWAVSYPDAWVLDASTLFPNVIDGLGPVEFERVYSAGDVDVDGRPDFVVKASLTVDGQYGAYGLLYRGGDLSVQDMQPSAIVPLYPESSMSFFDMDVGPDVDGDGRPEVFVVHNQHQEQGTTRVSALAYHGPGQWNVVARFGADVPGATGYPSVVADFDADGDGHWELLYEDGFTAPNLRVYDAPFVDARIDTSSFLPSSHGLRPWVRIADMANVGDVDGDGFDDLLVAYLEPWNPQAVFLLRGGVSKAVRFEVHPSAVDALGRSTLTVRARLEGVSKVSPVSIQSFQARFDAPHWKYFEVIDARSLSTDRRAIEWRRFGTSHDFVVRPGRPLELDASPMDLFEIDVRFETPSTDFEFDLSGATALRADGVPLWTTASEVGFEAEYATEAPVVGPRHGRVSAYPSPANPKTTFRITAPEPGPVVLQVFDSRGRRVVRRRVELTAAGSFDLPWSAVDDSGRSLASGVYSARASGERWTATTRIVIVR